MKQKRPLVSILLPVRNSARFLEECLKSLKNQSYPYIEIIAIDDFSKDRSYKILTSFKKKDKRLRVSKNKKRYGIHICLNRALARARGSFIAFMDPQDINTVDRIKRQISYLMTNPKVVALGTQANFVNKQNKLIAKSAFANDSESIAKNLLSGFSLQAETLMINKTMLPKDLLYFKGNKYPFVFTELLVKLLPYGEITNLPWALYKRRRLPETSLRLKKLPSLIKHMVKSIALYDYRPSLRSIFFPAIKQA